MMTLRFSPCAPALLLTVAMAAPAAAADMGKIGPATVKSVPHLSQITAPIYDWTGFYIGIFGGGGNATTRYSDALGNTASYAGFGALAGATAGHNWQIGSVVIGAETDFAWTSLGGSTTIAPALTNRSELQWAGTIRGRAGFAVNQLLLFGTGGWAYGSLQSTSVNGATASASTTLRNGWTAGVGAEYAITPSLSGKIEYRYLDFGRSDSAIPINGAPAFSTATTSHSVAVGLNYKWGGPPVAKY